MYRELTYPDKKVTLTNGAQFNPLVTLRDEYGGVFHISTDDGCYVLYCERDNRARPVTHWFREAVESLKKLPICRK